MWFAYETTLNYEKALHGFKKFSDVNWMWES